MLEVREQTVGVEPERAIETLLELKKLGVQVLLDDYGAGNTSVQFLLSLKVALLGLGPTLVGELQEGNQQRTLVAALKAICDTFGLELVAAGVETRWQAQVLLDLGCPLMQGHWIAPPLDNGDFTRWWHGWQRDPTAFYEMLDTSEH